MSSSDSGLEESVSLDPIPLLSSICTDGIKNPETILSVEEDAKLLSSNDEEDFGWLHEVLEGSIYRHSAQNSSTVTRSAKRYNKSETLEWNQEDAERNSMSYTIVGITAKAIKFKYSGSKKQIINCMREAIAELEQSTTASHHDSSSVTSNHTATEIDQSYSSDHTGSHSSALPSRHSDEGDKKASLPAFDEAFKDEVKTYVRTGSTRPSVSLVLVQEPLINKDGLDKFHTPPEPTPQLPGFHEPDN